MVVGDAVIGIVVGDASVKAELVLAGHGKAKIVEHTECRRIRHVGVKHAAGFGPRLMNRGVDTQGGGVDAEFVIEVFAVTTIIKNLTIEIDFDQVRGGYFRPMQAVGDQQESIISTRHHHGEVIADALVETLPFRHAIGGSEINACGARFMSFVVGHSTRSV